MNNQVVQPLIVVNHDSFQKNRIPRQVAFFDTNGDPLIVVQTSSNMLLTDYEIAETAAPVEATDSVLEAIAKLEKRIVDVEEIIDNLE